MATVLRLQSCGIGSQLLSAAWKELLAPGMDPSVEEVRRLPGKAVNRRPSQLNSPCPCSRTLPLCRAPAPWLEQTIGAPPRPSANGPWVRCRCARIRRGSRCCVAQARLCVLSAHQPGRRCERAVSCASLPLAPLATAWQSAILMWPTCGCQILRRSSTDGRKRASSTTRSNVPSIPSRCIQRICPQSAVPVPDRAGCRGRVPGAGRWGY